MKLSEYRKLAPALNEDLRAVFLKHGLKMGKLTASVDELSGAVRYSITADDMGLTDASGAATTPEAERYKAHCGLYGFDPAWLGGTFMAASRGAAQPFTVLGLLDTRSEKNVSVMVGGKKMRMSPETLVRCVKQTPRVPLATPSDNLIA
jgi:hypothetical protein